MKLPVCLFEPLQSQDQQLGVVFVGKWGERYGREAPTLQPVHSGCVNGHSLFCSDVRSVLEAQNTQIKIHFSENKTFTELFLDICY